MVHALKMQNRYIFNSKMSRLFIWRTHLWRSQDKTGGGWGWERACDVNKWFISNEIMIGSRIYITRKYWLHITFRIHHLFYSLRCTETGGLTSFIFEKPLFETHRARAQQKHPLRLDSSQNSREVKWDTLLYWQDERDLSLSFSHF